MYVAYVWSLCDGLTSVEEILDLSRLDTEKTLTILGALRACGALLLPGELPGDLPVSDWPISLDSPAEPDLPGADASRSHDRFARGTDSPPARRAVAESSERSWSLFSQACVYESSGNFDDALRLFSIVVQDAPSAEHLRRAAQCALTGWDLELAERWILDAIELNSADPATLRVLADVYFAQQRYVRAEVVLNRAIELSEPDRQLAAAMRIDLAHVRKLLSR